MLNLRTRDVLRTEHDHLDVHVRSLAAERDRLADQLTALDRRLDNAIQQRAALAETLNVDQAARLAETQ